MCTSPHVASTPRPRKHCTAAERWPASEGGFALHKACCECCECWDARLRACPPGGRDGPQVWSEKCMHAKRPCRTCAAAGAASSVRAAGGRMWPEVLHERSSAYAFSAHVRAEMHRSLPPRQQEEAPGGCWLLRARCCVARLFSMHAAVTRAPMGSPSLFGTVRVHIGYACAACFCGWTVSVSIL